MQLTIIHSNIHVELSVCRNICRSNEGFTASIFQWSICRFGCFPIRTLVSPKILMLFYSHFLVSVSSIYFEFCKSNINSGIISVINLFHNKLRNWMTCWNTSKCCFVPTIFNPFIYSFFNNGNNSIQC